MSRDLVTIPRDVWNDMHGYIDSLWNVRTIALRIN